MQADDDSVEEQALKQKQRVRVEYVRDVCQVTFSRAQELLEAASGSVERAFDIHVSSASLVSLLPPTGTSASVDLSTSVSEASVDVDVDVEASHTAFPTPSNSRNVNVKERKRQATIGAAVAASGAPSPSLATKGTSSTSMPTPSKQRKLDSFFASVKSQKKETNPSKQDKNDSSSILVPKHGEEIEPSDSIESKDPRFYEQKQKQKQTSCQSDELLKLTQTPTLTPIKSDSDSDSDPRLDYVALARTFAEMCATPKRTIKLQALQTLFRNVMLALGGIHEHSSRDMDSHILSCTIDLVLGKISTIPAGSNNNNAAPLQISGAAVSTAIQTVTGLSRKQIREAYRKAGDFGDVAANHFVARPLQHFVKTTSRVTPERTIQQIHDMLHSIATVPQGKGSQAARQNLLLKLLRGCKEKDEMRFLIRTFLGNMRLGATIKSVLAGLAMAVQEIHGKDFISKNNQQTDVTQTLQQIFYICPRIEQIAHALLCGGIPCAEDRCSLAVGFPIHPMLANPSHSLEQVEQFVTDEGGRPLEAVAEWKYDGMRCQAHWDGSKTKLFSRHLLDTTEQYPDAVEYLSEAIQPGVESYIIDAEIVGVVSTGENDCEFRLLPFQDLSTRRGTKQEDGRSVQIRIYAFDLLYLNGVSLIKQPLYERQRALLQHFKQTAGFAFVSSITLARYDEALIQNFLKEAVHGGAEGLMIKLTGHEEATSNKTFGYESGTRGQLWLKLKRDYMTDFADTIDVVPIGAWHGTGRKAEKGFLSPILLAVYDEDEGVYRSISRCMTFSDNMYAAMREFYFRGTPYPPSVGIDDSPQGKAVAADAVAEQQGGEQRLDAEDSDQDVDAGTGEKDADETCERVNCFPGRPSSAYIVTNESPTIWFKPLEVFEVSFADLSLSRVHSAGAGLVDDSDGRGIALRFPRFKRRRPDKSIEQATTTEEVAHLFCKQSKSSK